MPEPATKGDIERVIALMQDGFGRIDQRFDEILVRLDTLVGRVDRRIRKLEERP